MGLQEEIEETKKKLEEATKVEEKEEESEEVEKPIDDPVEEPKPEEEKPQEGEEKEEAEPKEEPAEEEEPDNAGYRKLRRDNAALKKKLAEKEEQPKEEPEEAISLPPEINDVVEREKMRKAGIEFNQLEDNFRKVKPDYDDISNAYKAGLYQSIRIQNPKLTHEQLLEQTNKTLLMKAGSYVRQGYDPIEEMYEEAKSLGFKALPKQEEAEEEEEIKPDLSKVARNRARNAGMAAAKGNAGKPQLTKQMAADLTVAEFSKLPKAEKERILNS